MDKKMLISVILPVYNGEAYINKCLDSLMNQTFDDFEVILINDGSTDRTTEICEKYLKKYSKIKFFFQENAGVSVARNLGIEMSEGKWLTFVDADDFVDDCYLSSLYEEQICTDADWVASEFTNYYLNDGKKDIRSSFSQNIFLNKDIRNEVSVKILWNGTDQKIGNPVAKLYKAEIIDKFHIRFNPNLKLYEDTFFNFEYSMHISSFAYLHESHYMRLLHNHSVIHVYRKNVFLEMIEAAKAFIQLKEQYHWNNKSDIHLYISFVIDAFHLYVFNNPNFKKEKKQIHKKYYAFLNQEPIKTLWDQVHIRNGFGIKEKIVIACIKFHLLSLWEKIHERKRKM